MNRKIAVGALLFTALIVPATGAVYASSEDVKPWEKMMQFRGNHENSAKDLNMSKEDFVIERNIAREAHRAGRMLERQNRLNEAVERGCITEAQMQEKMQKRGWRFSQ